MVLLTFDPHIEPFWLTRDHFPEFATADREMFPAMAEYATAFGPGFRVSIEPVPIPRDCIDGFLGAYWARPAAYLDPAVRAGISSFARWQHEEGIAKLRADLDSGAWHARNGHLLTADELDLGYRLVMARHLESAAN